MTFFRLLGVGRALVVVTASLLLALACSGKYHFTKDAPHCANRLPEPDLGESDLDCGGADCDGCALGQRCNTDLDCVEGACLDGFCQELGCENHALDGNETGVDCGGGDCEGCRVDQPCQVGIDCQSKVCGEDGTCAAPTCADEVRNGDELDVDCGGSYCDGCPVGSPCAEAVNCKSALCDQATGTCALNCGLTTDDCDGDKQSCETNLLTSNTSCGECGKICDLPNAESACVGGTCQLVTCNEPWKRCGSADQTGGCETNTSNDALNCGGCGMECPALNGEPFCSGSTCMIRCADGFGNCDKLPSNGCESPVNDVDNCGECDEKCPEEEGKSAFCVDGVCGLTDCDDDLGDCNGDGVCESDLTSDSNNCGRCGRPCGASRGTAACEDGRCVVDECEEGWRNCNAGDDDGGFADGCETNIGADPDNCGACGESCSVENGAGTCEAGSCAISSCAPGFLNCNEDTEDAGFGDGCEANTTGDPAHCGGCDNACAIPNARAACVDSTCVVDRCNDNFDDCNDAAGCETDTSSSVQHCGSCTGICSNAGATSVSCTNGACDAPVCDATHRSCDNDNKNGCERDITTAANCGACNNVCAAATPNCVPTNGVYKCQAQITLENLAPYPVAQTIGNTLSFQYTPHAGSNRLIMLAVTSESQGNGVAGARPDSVRFGDATMTAGPEQAGNGDYWSPDQFIYYVNEAMISTRTSQQTVTIAGATAPAVSALVVQLVQLNGVRQNAPISASSGGFLGPNGTPEAPDPSVIALTVPVATSGSVIYSFTSAFWMDGKSCPAGTVTSGCPTWSLTPSTNLVLLETVSTSPQTVSGTPMRAFGLYVSAPSAMLPAAGSYSPSWSIPFTGRMTHLAVVIPPATQ